MAKSSTRRVILYINCKEVVQFGFRKTEKTTTEMEEQKIKQRKNTRRYARYAEPHHVPPLKELRKTRAAAVSYRASVPARHGGREEAPSYRALVPGGEKWSLSIKDLPGWEAISLTPPPFRHTTYRFWPRQATSVWRNLRQHPCNDGTFTFSAKERDPETGLSYFGSRYYSSDLSIWLSVDPMSDKYASLSPYTYCADNPVKLVDPNGDSIINGLKYAYDYFLQQCNLAIEKCLKLDYNSNPIEYSNVKKEYDKASKNLEDVSCFYKTAEVAISNVKKYNKQLYNQMNNIKDDKGNAVDIVVLVNYSIGKYGNHSIPIQSLCPPSIIVQLNPIAKFDKYKDMGEVLSHEFGHLLYIIPNWSDYHNFLKTVNPSRHNGHDHDDPSGQEAHKQTQIYILNKIKQP